MMKSVLMLLSAAWPLLCSMACPLCDDVSKQAATVTVVTTPQQFKDAVLRGDAHIEIQAHLDMTTVEPADFRILGVLPETVKTIQGNCADPLPAKDALGLSGAPLLPVTPPLCLVATDMDLLYAWEGSVWLSQLYVRLKRTSRTDLPVLLHVNSSPAGQLWLSDSVLQGDAQGSCRALYADASAYVEGSTIADMGRAEASVIGRAGRTSISLRNCAFHAAPLPPSSDSEPEQQAEQQHAPVLQGQAASSYRLEGVTFTNFGRIFLLLDSQGTSQFFSDGAQPVWNEEAQDHRVARALEEAAEKGGWLTGDDSWLQEIRKVLPTLRRQAAPEPPAPLDPRLAKLEEVYNAAMRAMEEKLPLEKLPLESLPGAHLGPGPQVVALTMAVLIPLVLLCCCGPRRSKQKKKVA